MNTASFLLGAAAALCLGACATLAEPVAGTGAARQDTPVARSTPIAHVNPPETSSGY